MKKIIIILGLGLSLFFATDSNARGGHGGGSVHVNGYVRKDGTYIQPHYRTAPDGIKTNNWSYSGNVNPYTGKVGTSTDSSTHYRSGYQGGNSTSSYNYASPPVVIPNNDYTTRHGELHNHRTASYYTD